MANKAKLILAKHIQAKGIVFLPRPCNLTGRVANAPENARNEQEGDVHRGNKSAFDPAAYAYDIFRICKSTAPAIFFS